jgi:hypothetical protein
VIAVQRIFSCGGRGAEGAPTGVSAGHRPAEHRPRRRANAGPRAERGPALMGDNTAPAQECADSQLALTSPIMHAGAAAQRPDLLLSATARTLNGILRSGGATSGRMCNTGLMSVRNRNLPNDAMRRASAPWRRRLGHGIQVGVAEGNQLEQSPQEGSRATVLCRRPMSYSDRLR